MSLAKVIGVLAVGGGLVFLATQAHAGSPVSGAIDPNAQFVTGRQYRFTLQYIDSTNLAQLPQLLLRLGLALDASTVLLNGRPITLFDRDVPSAASDVWTVTATRVAPT